MWDKVRVFEKPVNYDWYILWLKEGHSWNPIEISGGSYFVIITIAIIDTLGIC